MHFFYSLSLVFLAACGRDGAGVGTESVSLERTNLLLVVLDTARADHFGFMGYARSTTPHLDAMAAESLLFEDHHAHSSRTGPSMASVFTGLHGPSHGVVNPLTEFDAKGTLADTRETLAETLSGAGWRTQGFVANLNVSARFGFSQGFDGYQYAHAPAAEINRAAGNWLKNRGPAPFFLYLHYMETHSPYQAPASFGAPFANPLYSGPIDGSHEQLDEILKGELILSDADRTQLKALYDQELAYFDSQFGALLSMFESDGLLDNTLVVFLSDHGEEFFDHGAVLHGYTLFEEQLHVPLLLRGPGVEPARVSGMTRHVDVMPTILEMLGVEAPRGMQGTSLVPQVKGQAVERPLYAQTQIRAIKTAQVESFTGGVWKLVRQVLPKKDTLLFDLGLDPAEQSGDPSESVERAEQLSQELEAFRARLPVAELQQVQLNSEEIGALKALGYLE